MVLLLKNGIRDASKAMARRHHRKGIFSGAPRRPLLPGLNRLGIGPDGKPAPRQLIGRGNDNRNAIPAGRRRAHAVQGKTKFARRFLIPIHAPIVFETMDEPERLHHEEQERQQQSGQTAAWEHGFRTR
jgi:hypothetical protein